VLPVPADDRRWRATTLGSGGTVYVPCRAEVSGSVLRVVATPCTTALSFQGPLLMRADLQGTYLKADDTGSTAPMKIGDVVLLRNAASGRYLLESSDIASLTTSSSTATRWRILGYNCGCSTGSPVAPGQFRLRLENTTGLDRLKVHNAGNTISVVSGGGDSANWRFYDAPPYPP
jgi:hypothetical protein